MEVSGYCIYLYIYNMELQLIFISLEGSSMWCVPNNEWLGWRYNGLKLGIGIKKRAHFFGQDIRHYIKGFSSAALIVHLILGGDLNDTDTCS